MAILKCLTLKQPWCWAIFYAGKNIENRRWLTNYRGPLYIHAGKAYDDNGENWIKWKFDIQVPPREELQFGLIMGAVQLIEIAQNQNQSNDWALPDQYHWIIARPELLITPIPARGNLGIWEFEVSDEIVKNLQAEKSNWYAGQRLLEMDAHELHDSLNYGSYFDPII